MNTYTALLHTHRLVVTLFLLLYVMKGALLVLNKKEALAQLTRIARIPEMVISTLFLITGIWLLFEVAEINALHILKVTMVFASIPIAVIGFRKSKKILAGLSVLLLFGVYGIAEANKIGVEDAPLAASIITDPALDGYESLRHGEALYTRNCVVCHGEKGNLMRSGAKNLLESQLTETEMQGVITNGKNAMPAYGDLYGKQDVEAVVQYVNSLQNK